ASRRPLAVVTRSTRERRGGPLRRTSANGVEFEDTSALGRFHRIVEIDTVDDADEVDTKRNASRERTEHVAEVPNPLRRAQLGRGDLFCPAPQRDSRAAGGAQIAHPLDLAPRGPDPPPVCYRNDCQRRSARQATLAAANGDKSVEAQWNASDQQEL